MHAEVFLAPIESTDHGTNNAFRMQSLLHMKHRRKSRFDVDNAIILHVLERFVSDAFERLLRLHHAARVLETLQIQRQAAAVRIAAKPFGEFFGISCGKAIVSRLLRQLDDRCRSQSAVEVVVKQDLGKPSKEFRAELHI